jgi:serine/threonine protein phosphatase PrpC
LASLFKFLLGNNLDAPDEMLKQATLYANQVVNDFAKSKGGATLSAVLVRLDKPAFFVNVGDSRIYVSKDSSEPLERITVDDTLKEAFGGVGAELVQFIGVGRSILPRVGFLPSYTKDVLLTSDGAHFVGTELLSQIVTHANDPRRISERITAISRWMGGPDNSSVCTLRLDAVMARLNKSFSSQTTVWSGASELQLVYGTAIGAPSPTVTQSYSAYGESSGRSESPPHSQAREKKKSKKEKKRAQLGQLEIKIDRSEDDS